MNLFPTDTVKSRFLKAAMILSAAGGTCLGSSTPQMIPYSSGIPIPTLGWFPTSQPLALNMVLIFSVKSKMFGSFADVIRIRSGDVLRILTISAARLFVSTPDFAGSADVGGGGVGVGS